ncbi:MAG: class I SAM-dependent methyltransferase [Rickettsia aeschlimannii]
MSINILIVGKNIQYYNNNAQEFYSRTINADLSDSYKAFTSYLPEQAHILDAGCGVGRDTKYFLSQGYQVTAFDGSTEMVKLATKETGIDVLHSTFQDIDFKESFDGV